MTLSHNRDVFRHMSWADAVVWSAIFDSDIAASDDYINSTFFHLHVTQHSFLDAWQGAPFRRWTQDLFAGARELAAWGAHFHDQAPQFLEGLRDADLQTPMILPWAKYFTRTLGEKPQDTTLAETLHQLSSHSMHHRGQIIRRLRELGQTPPTVDYIVWVWTGRPSPDWSF